MRRVLVINDSRLERYILKDQLARLDFQVEAVDEYYCLQNIKNFSPEAVIVNLTMRNISGDELIKLIKEEWPGIKCYLSSCNHLNLDDYRAKGVDGVLKTPATLEQLKMLLAEEKISFRFCPYCGQDLTREGKSYFFCPFCGARL